MSASYRRLLLLAMHTDTLCEPCATGLRTRCIHCRSWLYVQLGGEAISAVTIEHIVPQAWFTKPRVIALLQLPFALANAPENLALACARCNHDKGRGHDTKPGDTRAREVILALLQRRLARWKPAEQRADSVT